MPRRVLQGIVVSDVCDKTRAVLVESLQMHKVYKKIIMRSKKFLAHDENNQCSNGDKVYIRECRPISKRKKWEILIEKPSLKNNFSNLGMKND